MLVRAAQPFLFLPAYYLVCLSTKIEIEQGAERPEAVVGRRHRFSACTCTCTHKAISPTFFFTAIRRRCRPLWKYRARHAAEPGLLFFTRVIYPPTQMNQINRQTEKLEANEYVSDAEVEGALQEFAGEFSGIASDLSAAPRKYLIMLVPAKVCVCLSRRLVRECSFPGPLFFSSSRPSYFVACGVMLVAAGLCVYSVRACVLCVCVLSEFAAQTS